MLQYVMVPREIIYRTDLGNKRVIAYASLMFSQKGLDGLSDALVLSGYSSTNRNRNGARNAYKRLLAAFTGNGIIPTKAGEPDLYAIPPGGFGIIQKSEFMKIVSSGTHGIVGYGKVNQARTLLLLAYLRCNTIRLSPSAAYTSNLLSRIANGIGLSKKAVTLASGALEQLNIVHSEELPRYQDSTGCWHSNVHVFVDMDRDWESVVSKSINHILSGQIV